MNAKKLYLFLLLVAVVAASIFAQNVPLRDGIYKAGGKADEITVQSNMDFNPHGGNQYQRNNYYLISSYDGAYTPNGPWCVDAGRVRGSEIQTYVVWIDLKIGPQRGINEVGDPVVYTIVDTSSFKKPNGEVWTWNRELPAK